MSASQKNTGSEFYRNGTIVNQSGTRIFLHRKRPEVWIEVVAAEDLAEDLAERLLDFLNGGPS